MESFGQGSEDMNEQNAVQGPVPAERIQFGEPRRYLVNIDSISTNQLFADCVIVGAGVAGLRAAIEAADQRNVIVVCKAGLEDSNTWKAQGGIASVLRKDDSFESHVADTLRTGCGLSEPDMVEQVVHQGPELVRQLQEWGAGFDRVNGEIDTTLEGGHSHARIIHGHGDETGRAIAETLIAKVRSKPNIRVIEHFFTIDLLTDADNRCIGIIGRGQGPRLADHLGGQHDPRHRRRRAALPRNHEPAGRHRRRPGDGLSGRRGPARHGVRAVPPDDALHRRGIPRPDHGDASRRRAPICSTPRAGGS